MGQGPSVGGTRPNTLAVSLRQNLRNAYWMVKKMLLRRVVLMGLLGVTPLVVACTAPAGAGAHKEVAAVAEESTGFADVNHDAMTNQFHRLTALGETNAAGFGGVYFDEGTGVLTVRYLAGEAGNSLLSAVKALPPVEGDVPVLFKEVDTSLAAMKAVVAELNESRAWAGSNAGLVHEVSLNELKMQIRVEASGAKDELARAVQSKTGFTPKVVISPDGVVFQGP
jgi:hypothetical protein